MLLRSLPLIGLFCLFACADQTLTPDLEDPDQVWTYSLSNPVPDKNIGFEPGDRLRIDGDSVIWLNSFFGGDNRLPLLSPGSPDSLRGIVVTPAVGNTISVTRYANGKIFTSALFEPLVNDLKIVEAGELAGRAFRFKFPDMDSMTVAFQYNDLLPWSRGEMADTYVSTLPSTWRPRSAVISGSNGMVDWRHFTPALLEGGLFQLINTRDSSFNRYRYRIGHDENGDLVARYVTSGSGRHEQRDMPLVPYVPALPAGVSRREFARRLSTGPATIDRSYPEADSANVAYKYSEDLERAGILEYDQLGDVELEVDPTGFFVLRAWGKEVIRTEWRLSEDRGFLIAGKPDAAGSYWPIVAWEDDYVAFRLPLLVKTRTPRGVKLESFVKLDAYVRVNRADDATLMR